MVQPILYAVSDNVGALSTPPQTGGPIASVTAYTVSGQRVGRYDYTDTTPTAGPFPLPLPLGITATSKRQVFVNEVIMSGPNPDDPYIVGVRQFPSSLGGGTFREFTDFPDVLDSGHSVSFGFLLWFDSLGNNFPLLTDDQVLYWIGAHPNGSLPRLVSYPFTGGAHIANLLPLTFGPETFLLYSASKDFSHIYAIESPNSYNIDYAPIDGSGLINTVITSGVSSITVRSICVDKTTGFLYVLWVSNSGTTFTIDEYDQTFNLTNTYSPSSSIATNGMFLFGLAAGDGKIFASGGVANSSLSLQILDAIWVIDAQTGAGTSEYLFSLSGASAGNLTGHLASALAVGGGATPPFRQRQRDDGLVHGSAPRVAGSAQNTPTSRQGSIRQGGKNTYY